MVKPRRLGALLLCLVATSALGLAAPSLSMAQAGAPAPARVVAFGDVHGDLDSFAAILQRAGLLDARRRWAGGNATLVQTGDFLDRGAKDRQVMDLLMALEKQAPKKRGRVVVLLGNHEVMNLAGDLRYTSRETFAAFADKGSEKRRQAAYRDLVALREQVAQARGHSFSPPAPEEEAAWMAAHPPGFLEHRRAFAPDGKYGRWLRAHAAVARIGGGIYVHGGISPAVASASLDALNRRIAEEIATFDRVRDYLVARQLALPFFTLEELARAAQAELDVRNAELARKAAAAPAGASSTPDPETKRHLDLLAGFLGYGNWHAVHPEGPLWFRGYANWSDAEGAAQVARLLAAYQADYFVVGHTPQRDGQIRTRFDGKVFLIDTGMLAGYFPGGRASALDIRGERFTAVYLDQSVTLRDAAPPRSLSLPAAGPGPETEFPGGPLAQVPAAEPRPARVVWYDPEGNPLPLHTDADVMEFLRRARVVRMKATPIGIAGTRKALLEMDGRRMNAAFRTVNQEKMMMRMADGRTELQFRDAYIFESAAYELSRLLGLDNVPPTVERRIFGEEGTLQAWVEGGLLEGERQRKKIPPPDPRRWNQQVQVMRIFDNLIYNTDRNMGNILIDRDWKVWWIDHTRAFRRYAELQAPDGIIQCERGLYERLRALDAAGAQERLKKYLRKGEIEAIFQRREKLLQHIEQLVRARGESEVFFRWD